MNDLTIWNYEGNNVRTLVIDDETWFIGRDICNAFGDTNSRRSLSRIDNDDKKIIEITDVLGRKQKTIFVNEGGMYALLFTMQPQKANNNGVSNAYPIEVQERIEKLHRFKRWVTHEVLPQIRKTGSYNAKEKSDINTRIKISEQLYKLAKMSGISREQRINLIAKSAEVLTGEQVISPTTTSSEENDLVFQFLDEYCELRTAYDGVTTKVLYDAFKTWCFMNGERYIPKKSQFSESLCNFYNVEPTKAGRSKIIKKVNGICYYPHTLTKEAKEILKKKIN